MSALWRFAVSLVVLSIVTSVSFVFLPQRIEFAKKTEARVSGLVSWDGILNHNGQWFNSLALTENDLKDEVVMVVFFRFSEFGSREMMEQAANWHEIYSNQGLEIVGVHMPKWAFEEDNRYLADNIGKLGLEFPIIQDDGLLARIYEVADGPAWMLFDRRGDHVANGKGSFDASNVKEIVKDLIAGKPSFVPRLKGAAPAEDTTIKTIFSGGEDKAVEVFDSEEKMKDNLIYYSGEWARSSEALVSEADSKEVFMALKFNAYSVRALLAPTEGKGMKLNITLDDKPIPKELAGEYITYDSKGQSFLQVHDPQLYTLIDSFDRQEHVVKIYPEAASITAYSITLEE